jgi:hypothetical protein
MSTNMLSSLSATQLRQAAAIREQIDALEKRLDNVLSGGSSSARAGTAPTTTTTPAAKKRTMSPAARARIAAAQKKRWARIKAAKKGS